MEEKNSFAVIREDLPRVAPTRGFLHWLREKKIIGEPMVIIREDKSLITETEKGAIVVFDINETEIASVELKNGVLEIIPKIENVSKLICKLSDFDEENNIIETTEDVILQSKGDQSQTTISQSPLAKARCHPC